VIFNEVACSTSSAVFSQSTARCQQCVPKQRMFSDMTGHPILNFI